LVTATRALLFGDVVDQAVHLSRFGEIVYEEWMASGTIRSELTLDKWVVMPNHVHGIVWFEGTDPARPKATTLPPGRPAPVQRPPRSLGAFVAGFKGACTKRINVLRDTPRAPVWQRNYYERVIRNERQLNALRQYILDNPANWAKDIENPIKE
jgi:REP element-mobilizing transposase RayT